MIPKVIHQIWVGPDPLPDNYAPLVEKIRAMHPGWQHHLWTEANLPQQTIRDEWRNKLRMPAERSDLLRLELLYTYGGIYLDIDFDLHKPLDPVVTMAPIVVCDLKPGRVNNAFIAAVPDHPVIHTMILAAKPREYFGLDKDASGSLFVDRMLAPYKGKEVKVLRPPSFYAIEPTDESYATHLSERSWKQDDGWKKVALTAERRLKAANSRIKELERLHGWWTKITPLALSSQVRKRLLGLLRRARLRRRLTRLVSPARMRKRVTWANRVTRFACADWGSRLVGRPLHRSHLPYLLNRRGLTGMGAEIGVKRGVHSEIILSRWHGKKLYLVDPWEEQQDESYVDRANVDQERHNQFYDETLNRLSRFDGRFEIIRDYSVNAARQFADGSLDFVYIDARHDYDSVLEDLHEWYPKVRIGGVIAGHDYIEGLYNGIPYGVKAAVRAFAKRCGYTRLAVKRTWEPWPSFYLVKTKEAAAPETVAPAEPARRARTGLLQKSS